MFYLTVVGFKVISFLNDITNLLTMGIIFLVPKLPKLGKLLPSPLVSIIIIFFLVIMFKIDILTVGDLASVSGGLPEFSIPVFHLVLRLYL